MKITRQKLQQLIKEELTLALENFDEYDVYDEYDPADDGPYGAGGPTGSGRFETCPNCNGEGITRHPSGDPQTEEMCPVCRGEGEVEVYE